MATPFSFVDAAATIGATEFSLPAASTTLTAQTVKAYVQAFIDFSAMTASETYRVTFYESVNGGSQLVVYHRDLVGVQDEPILAFPNVPLMVGNGWNITVKKIAGTDRSIGWSIRKDTGDRNLVQWLASTPNALIGGGVPVPGVVRTATAQAGAAQSITLDAGAVATNGFYYGSFVVIVSGTGAGQSRRIVGYTGSSKIAVVDSAWSTAPDATSVFVILASAQGLNLPTHTAVTGTLTATAFTTDLTEATNDHWKDAYCRFISGALAGQVKKITSYTGSTKALNFTSGFTGAPSNGDLFVIVNG